MLGLLQHFENNKSLHEMRNRLAFLTRLRNRYLMGFDLLGLIAIPSMAMMLRTDNPDFISLFSSAMFLYTFIMICVKMFAFQATGLYRELWAYASIHEMMTLLRTCIVGGCIEFVVFALLLLELNVLPAGFPRSIPILCFLLTVFWIGGSRMGIRILYTLVNRRETQLKERRVLIVGAGAAGALTVKELQNNIHMGIVPIGFVDDDLQKVGKRIHGVPVYGTLCDIPAVVRDRHIAEVIIAMPTVSGKVIRNVVHLCREVGVPSKTVPALFDIVRGTARIEQVRSIQLEDLLRRGVIQTDTTPVMLLLTGSKVLITGAGGSIGSELCRQIKQFNPAELILLGHGETSVFQIMKELQERPNSGMKITPVIADVRDRERMEQVFRELQPTVVFHAAAHKHVWLMQQNIADAVSNNVQGTQTLVDLATANGVQRFVMISSDKAVNPTSIMGVTKRAAELIVQDAANRSGKAFVTVRFGNVLGSRGSVVPLFKRQIDMGGPVTVTDARVTRYFMTIPEAVQLVLQAATMGVGGEVFVLDMGEQIKVIDLARDLIRLSGFSEEEIGIKITGLLPGEKMYEELFHEGDRVELTKYPKIMVCRRNYARDFAEGPHTESAIRHPAGHESSLQVDIATLIESAQQGSIQDVETLLHRLVPQYRPPCQETPTPPDATVSAIEAMMSAQTVR